MNRGLFVRLLICTGYLGTLFYTYIDRQNGLTELKMEIPRLVKRVDMLEEENALLTYEIEKKESPSYLLELLRTKEFSHLRYPYINDVVVVKGEKCD